MPNRRTHVRAGATTGVVTSLLMESRITNAADRLAFTTGAAVGGAFGGALPDMLDPPVSPNHRAFFHSVGGTGAGILIGLTTPATVGLTFEPYAAA